MIFAQETWSGAAVAVAVFAAVTIVISVAVWQIFATRRTGLSAKREQAYQRLAEEATDAQRKTAERLEKAVEELAQLRK